MKSVIFAVMLFVSMAFMIPGMVSATVLPPVNVNVTVPPIKVDIAPVVGSGLICQNFKTDGISSKVASCTPIVASSGFNSIAACRSHFKSYLLNTDPEAHAGVDHDTAGTAGDAFTAIQSFVKYSCTSSGVN